MDRYRYASLDDVGDRLEEAEDLTGLDADVFDGIRLDASLPDNVPAATRVYRHPVYGEWTEFLANETFFELPEDQQRVTATHELLEGVQAKYDLGEVFQEEFDVSDDLADVLSSYQRRDDRLREGMTQALANTLVPGGERSGRYFYPYETQAFEAILDGMDIDLTEDMGVEEELMEEYVMDPAMYGVEASAYRDNRSYEGLKYDGLDVYDDVLEGIDLYDEEPGQYSGPAS